MRYKRPKTCILENDKEYESIFNNIEKDMSEIGEDLCKISNSEDIID